jgi:hypothetical protein
LSELYKIYGQWLYVTNPESRHFGKRARVLQPEWNQGGSWRKYCPHLEIESIGLIRHVPSERIGELELMDHLPEHKTKVAALKLLTTDAHAQSQVPFVAKTLVKAMTDQEYGSWNEDELRIALIS